MGVHYLIDRNGNVVVCVPEKEVAYANRCSWEGIIVRFVGREINDKMEQAAVELTEDICTRHEIYGIRRHYDFTGKQAPFVYVMKPSKFKELRERITGFTPEPVVYDESEDDEDDYYYE